jgi:hypothetical protein
VTRGAHLFGLLNVSQAGLELAVAAAETAAVSAVAGHKFS